MKRVAQLRQIWSGPGSTIALVRRLFSETYRDHVGVFFFAVACMAIASASTAASAWLMRDVVNDIFVSQRSEMILVLSSAIVAISVARGFATYGQTVLLGRIGNAVTATYQRRIIDKLLTLDLEFFSGHHSSRLITRIAKNAQSASKVIMMVSTSLGRDLLTVCALGGVMAMQDPTMFLIAISVAPAAVIGVSRIVRQIKSLAAAELQSFAAVLATTQETIQGMRIVKAFTLERTMRERVNDALTGAERRANRINTVQASASPLMESLGGISIGLVVLYAGWQTTMAGKTPGEFMAFIAAFLLAYEPFKRLARLNIGLQRSLKGVRIMYDLLDTPPGEQDAEDAVALDRAAGHVALKNVDFGYSKKVPVLHDVSIAAAPGEVIALVGPSGAGKSTIVSLIQRFYDPWSGRVEIDGKDIRRLKRQSLRRNMSFVSQDTFLFSGTVYENIALGRPGASELEVEAAADAALAKEFIEALPQGFHSDVGENGVTLSGGQRQRIAIARAILRNAPILLLDEATSALDTESERQVRKAIERLMFGRTTIVIAHRLSTIIAADRTYVIDRGRVAASGRHDNLLVTSDLYRMLFGPDDGDPNKQRDALTDWEVVA
jgi:ATP-binding cassette subfamily B protein